MNRCAPTVLLAASAAAALTACSSSTSGTGTTSSAGASSASRGAGSSAASSSSTNPASSTGAATTPEGLASTLRQGLNATTAAHITLHITTGGQSITGSGDETLDAGKVKSLKITEKIPNAGTLVLIQVGGKTYAKLPASINKSTKPYILVTPTSSDPTIKSLAASLQSSQSTAVDNAGVFASAAKSISDRGSATVYGVRTTHYFVVVDVAKLPSDYAGKAALVQAGVRTLPINLYVDSSGRPAQVTEQLTVSGQNVATVFGVTKYNQPVTITAPPASQVSTK